MNKNDKAAAQNLETVNDKKSDTLPSTRAGLADLPSYEVMAQQLRQNGVMTQEDIQALDHLEAFDRAMAMATAMAMSGLALDEIESLEERSHALQHVRSFIEWKDYVLVARFLQEPKGKVKLPFPHTSQSGLKPPVPNYNNAQTQNELQELFWKQNHPEREERLQDIIDQDYDYLPTFMHHLGIDPHQHSDTHRLIETLGFLGAMVVMPWKLKYRRLRPSQLDKHLKPVILVPAHPAYPSGHATQAYLTAEALKEIMHADMHVHIDHVATEIAVNREWAGVHYESDTDAGKNLGQDIWEKAFDIQEFKDLIEEARKEWA